MSWDVFVAIYLETIVEEHYKLYIYNVQKAQKQIKVVNSHCFLILILYYEYKVYFERF